jgi:leader peptidase (prepilin peptidase)/N-methyltransferase
MLFGFISAIFFISLSVIPDPNIKGTCIEKILASIYGALVGFAPLFIINVISKVLFKRDGMGGGDMKLMAVTGLFLGMNTIVAMLFAIYLGGFAGAIILIFSKKKSSSLSGHYMPFGPFLALGSFVSMLYGTDIIRWYIGLIS